MVFCSSPSSRLAEDMSAVVMPLFSTVGIPKYWCLLGHCIFILYCFVFFFSSKAGAGKEGELLFRANIEQMCCTLGRDKDVWDGSRWRGDGICSSEVLGERRMAAASLPSGHQGAECRVREAPALFVGCLEFSALVQHLWLDLKIKLTCVKENKEASLVCLGKVWAPWL